ncbi:DUF3306 domain-containing protein [Sulfitobacter aestuarii]|uniref:DUF3306 domain-containing protein n=1 Tax=Sulfitobacter aestuarii TaxID=2161676 RepID=A0ABW5U323_9RHOB
MSAPDSFWARRRAAVQAEAEAEAAEVQAAREREEEAALAERSDAEILAELDLPDPDTLEKGDDFSAYLARAVPERIRQRALRRLWRSNPVLACVDGLNDYDEDYLAASIDNGPVRTSYQVGRGLTAHLVEMQRQAEAVKSPSDAALDKVENLDDDTARQGQTEDLDDRNPEPQPRDQQVAQAAEPVAQMPREPEEATLQPRRMVFYFDGDM